MYRNLKVETHDLPFIAFLTLVPHCAGSLGTHYPGIESTASTCRVEYSRPSFLACLPFASVLSADNTPPLFRSAAQMLLSPPIA